MSEPHPELRRLVAAHRKLRRPPPELRERVARALAADRRQELRRQWIGGSLIGVVVGVAALLVAHWVAVGVAARGSNERAPDGAQYQSPRDDQPERARARGDAAARDRTDAPPPLAPTPTLEPPPSTTATPDPPPPPRPATAREPTTKPKPSAAALTSAELASEVRLLREAEVALSTDPVRALALLQAHVHQFPRTSLALERQALQILARCAAAPGDAAIHDRDVFLRDHPGSAYAPRVRAVCR